MNLEQKQALMRQRHFAGRVPSELRTPDKEFSERHYTVAEIAEMWNLSAETVRRLFGNEPGVLVIGDDDPDSGTRRYRTLRIPESVLTRVHRRMTRV
jgi:hypothetical protein